MKITKFGHACILAEVNSVSILCDPGNWNATPTLDSLDAILITHEHQDHADIPQIKTLLAAHPNVRIITHEAVGKILTENGIAFEKIEPGEIIDVNGVPVESFGTEHAVIYRGISPGRNTGFLINEELFVTGDALHDMPNKKVRILALPTGGPWMKIGEALEYTKEIQPEFAFPVHDAMYTDEYKNAFVSGFVGKVFADMGIALVDIENGGSHEF